MFQTSLRAKLLGLIAGSLLVLLCIALLCTQLLSRQVSEFAELLDGPIRESQLIEQVNLEFKTQVQEWKNVLLRGQDDAQRTRYWQQFQDQEAKVQGLLGELLQRYHGEVPAQSGARYRDYIEWLQRQDAALSQRFWSGQLAVLDEPTRLVQVLRSTTTAQGYTDRHYALDQAETRKLNEFAREQRVTLNTLVQAAWLLLLQRYTGQATVTFG